MSQVEVNIRDHTHGADGVIKTGISFVRTAKTATFNVTASDVGQLFDITSGTFSVTFDAAATLGAGFAVTIRNSGTGVLTLDPNGAETINGLDTLSLAPLASALVYSDGSNLLAIFQSGELFPIGAISATGQASQLLGIDLTPFNVVRVSGFVNASATTGYLRARLKANGSVQTGASYDWDIYSGSTGSNQTDIELTGETGAGTGNKSGVFEFNMLNGPNTDNEVDRSAASGSVWHAQFTGGGSTFWANGGWQAKHADILANAVEDIEFRMSTGNIDITATVYARVGF
jgi:hypothetical protein